MGSKNIVGTKGEIAHTIFRYVSVYDKEATYPSIYNTIWTPGFDPRDPDSGWGSRFHKSVYPLTGKFVSIVPRNTKGYYMDNSSNADTLNKTAYSATWIYNDEFNENVILDASVYCYVSNTCNASTVMICALGAMGNPGALYDLNRKGEWQRLNFIIEGKSGNAGILLYFSQYNVPDFSSLGGHIIFAYPEIKILNKQDSSLLKTTGHVLGVEHKDESYNAKRNINFIQDSANCFTKDRKENRSFSCGLNFYFLNNLLKLRYRDSPDKDPLRRFFEKLISEDTTYYPYSAEFKVGTPSFNFILGRTLRWQFAWQIYIKEFNLQEKIFGGGFNFLNWFGGYFFADKTKSDYPHNPIFSILLYSGILGLIIYLIFLTRLFKMIIKYYHQYFLMSLFFIITFFFSFFSSGSPFDPPIMGFFSILIFHIDHILGKDISN